MALRAGGKFWMNSDLTFGVRDRGAPNRSPQSGNWSHPIKLRRCQELSSLLLEVEVHSSFLHVISSELCIDPDLFQNDTATLRPFREFWTIVLL